MNNYLYEYYQGIQDGSIVVGRWVRLWYEKIIRGLESGEYRFSQKKANKAIRFIETFCHHCEGRNDLLTLELWQKALVSVVFGIVDETGARQFREVVIIMARKQGKTLFASAIIAYLAYLDGEYGAKIYCLAPKLEQANIVYDNFYQMILQEPELDALTQKRRSDIYIAEYNTSVRPVAFNAKKSDGFNPHGVVCDEIASWQGEAGLRQYEVMRSALGARRQPLMLSISTAGYVNDGIYDELIKRSTAVLLGVSRESRLAPFLYMIDEVEKWNDLNELRKSNPNLGVSVSVDYLLEEIAIAEEPVQTGGVPHQILQHQAEQFPGLAGLRHGGPVRRRTAPAGGFPKQLLCGRHRPLPDHRPHQLLCGHRTGWGTLCLFPVLHAPEPAGDRLRRGRRPL